MRAIFPILGSLLLATPLLARAQEESLEFHSALSVILARDTTIGSQSARVRATRAGELPNRLAFLPSVSVQHTEARAKARAAGSPTRDTERTGFNGAWNVFRSGADIAGWSAADANVESEERLLASAQLSAELEGARRIFNLIVNNGQVQIARKLYESIRDNHRIANLRFERGLLPRQEVEKVFIDLVNSEARLRDAEVAAVQANAQLGEALGHSRVRQEWPWQERFLKRAPSIEARELRLERVPTFAAAQHAYERERQRTKRDFRKMFVSADIGAEYHLRNTTTTADIWSGSLTFSLPVFDQLTNYSRYASQVESRAIAEYSLEQARRDAESEYKSARESYRTQLATALSRQESLAIARRLYRDNELRFKSGKITANDLIVDQNRLFTAEQNALEGWNGAHIAFIRLCHATGTRLAECEALP